jgi:hypothetical protein
MNKNVLSQLLDGAAFPAIMLTVAISQINVSPDRRDSSRQGRRLAAELRVGDLVEQKAKGAQGDRYLLQAVRTHDSACDAWSALTTAGWF